MMFVFKDISLGPSVVESAGKNIKDFPGSSVSINAGYVFNPAVTPLQELPTSGNYAQSNRVSAMRCQRSQGFSQTRKRSRQISPRSSQFAPKVRCVAHPLCLYSRPKQSARSTSVPHSPPARIFLLPLF